mmetsp:Transcript_24199/g.42534  ORF Transcript_24199/g.42534 Transcript_24199/m.42534 type:complete len:229 (-) Transcript_24199:170-856(-)
MNRLSTFLGFAAAVFATVPVHSSSSDYYYFKKYEDYACRNKHGDQGSDGHEFDLYEHKSKDWCIKKCEERGWDCKGFEYKSSDDRCEIWNVVIKKAEKKHGFDCYVQVHDDSDDHYPDSEDHKPDSDDHKDDDKDEHEDLTYIGDYHSWYGYACRLRDGGKGEEDYHYDLYKHVDDDDCEHICDDDHDCYAWEYKKSKDQCEIWKRPPEAVAKKYGYDCHIKYHSYYY